ncbi:MAG: RNA polymerase factor sigma-54 [Bacteroidales bacterium]|nr:RNA polymerase factor sigma-54 [Bacteroidales bacterium]
MLKQRLQQKLIQKLSPQQIQLIKLLEVPTIQLEQRIKKEIEENPVLEEGRDDEEETYDDQNQEDDYETNDDEFSIEDYIPDDDELPSYKLAANNYSSDDRKTEIPYSSGTSFHEHIEQQLGLRILTEKQQVLAEYIIGNIDEDGYLRRDIESIVNDVAFSQNIITTEKELLDILEIIHDFDPPGVGARDLQESLVLQLKHKIKTSTNEIDNIMYRLSFKIIKNHFNEFTKKHYEKITQKLNLSDDDLRDAVDIILHLNPKPGSAYSNPLNRNSQHITPDFVIENVDGELILSLNSKNVPDLRISRTYSTMLESYQQNKANNTRQQKEAISFVKQKLDSAKWFIDAIKQRQNTLMHTMDAIIQYQQEYFTEGDETRLRPMILKDIAEKTNLDISTISRVVNSKYIQTHFGIFPLKYFFSEGMQTDSGEEVSTREIKKILQECIDNESKKKPLTDEKLAEILQEKGYQIARRTVAKYREQLNIPVARMRKEL